jgi:hypothetical protein
LTQKNKQRSSNSKSLSPPIQEALGHLGELC